MTLDDLRRAAQAATEGPWSLDTNTPGDVVVWAPDESLIVNVGQPIQQIMVAFDCDEKNGAFIALSREAVPKLLAFVEAWDKFNALDPYGTEDWSDEQMDAYRVTVAARKKLEEG